MSTYEQLPTDSLVLVSCIQTTSDEPQRFVGVNQTDNLPFKCTEVLNQYHKRGYSIASHSLVHEAPGLIADGYFVGTWTMIKPCESVKLAESNNS